MSVEIVHDDYHVCCEALQAAITWPRLLVVDALVLLLIPAFLQRVHRDPVASKNAQNLWFCSLSHTRVT